MTRRNRRRRNRSRRRLKPAQPRAAAALSPTELRLRGELAWPLDLWIDCRRPGCRRAFRCLHGTAPCFDEQFDVVREETWERMVEICRFLAITGADLMEMADQVDREDDEEEDEEDAYARGETLDEGDARDEAADAAEVDSWLRELGKG